MKKIALTLVPAAIMLAATSVMSAELSLLRSFTHPGPSGLAYDDRYCGIWVANESRKVSLISPWGDEILTFDATLSRVDAIDMEGETLVLSDGNGTYLRVTRDGVPLGEPFRLASFLMDTDGLYIDPATHDLWVADDTLSEVVQLAADGTVKLRIKGKALRVPMLEPQGVTRDPDSGHILVVDDADATDSLFEFTPEGELLDVIPLGSSGYDAEGITIQPETGTVFIAYDDGDRIAAFSYEPTSPIAVSSLDPGLGGCAISMLPGALPDPQHG